jgi:RinA family phage transcriptional activator
VHVRKETFQHIEREIYDYKETKKNLDQLTYDIIHSTPEMHEIRGTHISDPTYFKATQLATHILRENMYRMIYAIDLAFESIDPVKRKALQAKYWHQKHVHWTVIADEFYLERKTLYNWRQELIALIAMRLGWY